MVLVNVLDKFIEHSVDLLEARPDTTKVTIKYIRKYDYHPADSVAVPGSKPGKAVVRVYDPVSGACYRVHINKSKALSRVLSALGPRGVSISSKKQPVSTSDAPETTTLKGFAEIMAGTEVPKDTAATQEALDTVAPSQPKSKKKGKNKK